MFTISFLTSLRQFASNVSGDVPQSTKTRVKIFQIMKENPSITVEEIAKATGLTVK
ncbi:MAG: winged helix-turn-helix domain-containing protein [Candidatus Omnitrophota bacterium]